MHYLFTGQEKPAEAVVESFAKTGGWVMLQNCHLMQSWVPKLERLLEVVQVSNYGYYPLKKVNYLFLAACRRRRTQTLDVLYLRNLRQWHCGRTCLNHSCKAQSK